MLKKKKNLLFASSLAGLVIGTTSISVALSACTSTTTTNNSDLQYSYNIDWDNEQQVKRLVIDNNGLVYADKTKTTVIAVSPKVVLNTVTIPSTVKNISGYVKVTTNSKGIKVYQQTGAFQNMTSLQSVTLQSGSQLKSIGGSAFSGCTALRTISGLSNSLDYIGTSAFANCANLESIDTSNVVKVDNNAFSGCTSLSAVNLSKTIYIGDNAFKNCSNLTSLGSSLEQLKVIGQSAFYRAIKSDSNISLKLSNLQTVSKSAFEGSKGIDKVDFSNNTLVTKILDNAFLYSSVTSVDFTGCSKLTTIGERTFEGCTNLTSFYLPSNDITNLDTIAWNAFKSCTSITTIAPKGAKSGSFIATKKLKTIGANSFAGSSITALDLSNFNVNSGENPFGSVTSLAFIPNLSSVILPNNITTLNPCLFYGSGIGDNGGFSLDLPSSIVSLVTKDQQKITNPNTTRQETIENATPFTGSGLTSIDMSKITSYQVSQENQTKIPSYLFNDNTKLTSVILKTDTTEIGNYAFQGTTALTSITYPSSSNTETVAEAVNGFIASSALTSIGRGAFYGAFSSTLDITVDLTRMNNSSSNTSAPIAFSNSNVVNLKLPTNIVTIQGNSFDNMTRLASVNFADLTALTTIYKSNFTNTQLTSIDLSKTQFQAITGDASGSGTLFTNLPNNCVVSLPNTIGNFGDVFVDKNNNPISFSYPNGLYFDNNNGVGKVSSGVFSFVRPNSDPVTNIKDIDLSSNSTLYSIGPNTFFGNSKLNSVTLNAKGIKTNIAASAGLFTTTQNITTNTTNTSSAASYTKDKISFGNNESLTSLNYKNFTSVSPTSIGSNNITYATEEGATQKTLFNTTNSTTWDEVAKIINSLSYQASATTVELAKTSKLNMSEWVATNGGSSVMNSESISTFTSGTSVKLTNSYSNTTDTSIDGRTINATDTEATIVHNGVTWKYTNDGTSIKLTGAVNMYKLTNTNTNKNYLVFFNESTYSTTGSTTTTYYVPSKQSVNVTLTIATKATTPTK